MPSLLRFIARNIAPPPSGPVPTGIRPRSSPPLTPLDADDLGAEVAEQRGAERARDVAAEIEDADTVENTSHRSSPAKDAGA